MLKYTSKIVLCFLLATHTWGSPVGLDVPDTERASENSHLNVNAPKVAIVEPAPIPVKIIMNENVQEIGTVPNVPPRESRNVEDKDLGNTINTAEHREGLLLEKFKSKCSHGDVTSCMMLKMLTYLNRMLKKASIHVTEGLQITQTASVNNAPEEKSSRAIRNDNEAVQLSQLVTDKLWAFVKSRALKWNILPETDLVFSANPDDQGTLNLGMSIRAGRVWDMARGKKNNLAPLLAAAAMKLGLLGGIAFKGLVLLVGKSLLLSKIALMLASILWLKKLFSQQRHVTYEVVAHPHHSHESHHGDSHSSGWGRNINVASPGETVVPGDAQNLAYKAQIPASA